MTEAHQDLLKKLNLAAKKANQRMLRLEQAEDKTPAYVMAQNDIIKLSGGTPNKTERLRFKEKVQNFDYKTAQKNLAVVNKFLKEPSSSKANMIKYIKERDSRFAEVFDLSGVDVSKIYRILKSAEYRAYLNSNLKYKDQMIYKIINVIRANPTLKEEAILQALDEMVAAGKDSYLIERLGYRFAKNLPENKKATQRKKSIAKIKSYEAQIKKYKEKIKLERSKL